MNKIVTFFLDLPFKLLGAVKTVFVTVFVMLACVALYSYAPVKDTVDPVVDKVVKNTPNMVKEPIKSLAEKTGLKQPERGVFGLILDKVYGIPSSIKTLLFGAGKITFEKLLDFIFNPIVLLIGCAMIYLKDKSPAS